MIFSTMTQAEAVPKPSVDCTLYLVTDRSLLGGRDLARIVRAAIVGGVTMVQLREKELPARDFVQVARQLLAITRPTRVPLIINDRVDVALAVGADGVHVGQDDIPADMVRRIIGPDKILGVTAHDEHELAVAVTHGADYVGTNAVFGTPTKADIRPPIGLDGLARRYAGATVPVVAIGGIDHENAADAIEAGADGVAVVRAIMAAPDTARAATDLRLTVGEALAHR